MVKLSLTISDVKRIIFLIHRKTILKIQIKACNPARLEHLLKIKELETQLNFVEAELKKFHDDDIHYIDRNLMEGYTEEEITGMHRSQMSKIKRKLKKFKH